MHARFNNTIIVRMSSFLAKKKNYRFYYISLEYFKGIIL